MMNFLKIVLKLDHCGHLIIIAHGQKLCYTKFYRKLRWLYATLDNLDSRDIIHQILLVDIETLIPITTVHHNSKEIHKCLKI